MATQPSPTNDAGQPAPGRRSPLVTWIGLAVIAAGLLMVLALRPFFISEPDGTDHHAVGTSVTGIQLEPLVGMGTPLRSAELEGSVVLVDLWGPWCPPCRRELPEIAKLAGKYRRSGDFRLLAVAVPYQESERETLAADTQRFLDAASLEIPVYADPDRKCRLAAQRAGIYTGSFPTTWVMDRHGVVRGVWKGYLPGTVRNIERLLDRLIAE